MSLYHSPHFWVLTLWGVVLLFLLFGQGENRGFELRYAAQISEDRFFPYAECLAAVPVTKESPKRVVASAKPLRQEKRIDINTADRSELMAIKGIGEVLADRIIAERSRVGGFTDMAQLIVVKGIGKKKLALMQSQAEVRK